MLRTRTLRAAARAPRRCLRSRLWMQGLEDRVTPSAPPAPPGFTSTTTNFADAPGLALPDSPAPPVTTTISVTGVGAYLHDLDVTTFITHTFPGDLEISLTSPAGTTVTIADNRGGGNDDVFNGTLWDDDADPANTVPFPGDTFAASNLVTDTTYAISVVEAALVPEEAFGAFIGENPNGTWTITFRDTAGADVGTLNNWSLDVTTLTSAPVFTPSKVTNGTAQAISSTGTPLVTSTVLVSGVPAYAGSVRLTTLLQHTNNANLDITLTSPAGTVVTITSDNGGANDDVFSGTTWADGADLPGNVIPFAGAGNLAATATYANLSARPSLVAEEALAAFRGEDPNGTWTLSVQDDTTADGGSLNGWTLEVFAAQPFGTPNAAASAADIAVAGGSAHTITVTYTDVDNLINFSTLDGLDLRVTGPGGYNELAAFVSAVPAANAAQIVATYSIPAAGGTWDDTDFGTYTITTEAGQVADTGGTFVPSFAAGSFKVVIPRTFTVSNANDAGLGSLRDAVAQANAFASTGDFIVFDPGFFAAAQTIALTSGEITITDSVTLTGTGNNRLTLLNAKASSATSRIFNIAGAGILTVNVSDMALAGGNATAAGGAVTMTDEVATFTNCVFLANQSTTTGGGAVAVTSTGKLTLVNCVVAGNTAAGSTVDGGAVRAATGSTVTVQSSSITGNSAGDDGGAFYLTGASLLMENSTVSGNTGNDQGGGFFLTGTPGSLLARNSTIEGNKAADGGGFRLSTLNTQLVIHNSTITNNTASVNGGGINRFGGTGTIQVASSIISGNFDTSPLPADQPDVYSNSYFYFGTSAIGNSSGILSPVDQGGNLAFGTPLLLNPLSGNGGPTLSVRPSAGSPVLEVGSNPGAVGTDQRGAPRLFGAGVDMGSVELNPGTPTATGSFANVTAGGGTTYTLQITYADDSAINVGTLDSNDIRVNGPNGFNVLATFKSVDVGTNGTPRVATYEFTAPGGTWTSGDNGLYGVYTEGSQVADTGSSFVPAGLQGFFTVVVPNVFLVTTTADAGAGSLRDTVALAVATPGPDVINFDTAGAFSGPATITLSGGEITIGDTMTINGTGAANLTVNNTKAAGTTSHVFNITGGGILTVNISGLTIAGGNTTTAGGGVTMGDEIVTFTNCTFTGNKTSTTGGGAVAITGAAGRLTLVGSTITGNSTTGTTADGGAIRATTSTFITVQDSVISGNTTGDDGGAIYSTGGSVTILNSSVVNNTATGTGSDGGAIFFTSIIGAGGFTVRNSTFSGNTAKVSGGAIALSSSVTGTVVVQNSTVTTNTASGVAVNQGGGGFHSADITAPYAATFAVESTILSGNTNAAAPDVFTKGQLDYKNSALGSSTGVGSLVDLGGNLALGAPLFLGGLSFNGGPAGMLTHLPGGVSPVRDAGSNPTGLANDQRGAGFPRLLQTAVDIGAVESVGGIPSASGTFVNITTSGGTVYTLTVQYDDETAINSSTVGAGDIRVTGPGGFNVLATFKSVAPGTNAKTEVATYEFTPPTGSWDQADNGTYTVSMEASQVADNLGNFVPAGTVGTFVVGIPLNLVVNATNDEATDTDGKISLREAVLAANAGPAADLIGFDAVVFASAQTITLTLGELAVNGSVTVTGPAAGVTVDGNLAGRVLNITNSTVSLSNMTLTKGKVAATGGAVLATGSALTFDRVIIQNSQGTTGGGLSLSNSALTATFSTVSGNVATSGGGGVYSGVGTSSPTVNFFNCTVSGNSSTNSGGGLLLTSTQNVTIRNSTISGNTSKLNGGGLRTYGGFSGALVIQNTTVTANTVVGTGIGRGVSHGSTSGSNNIVSSAIAQNTGGSATTGDLSGTVNVDYSLIGVGDGATITGAANIIGDQTTPANAQLLPLAGNGGPTQTHLPSGASPLLNVGSNPATLTTDQRGPGFPRQVGPGVDIGAVEVDLTIPTASGVFPNVTAPGGTAYSFQVTFTDDVAIDVSTLDSNDMRVTGPAAFNVLATFKGVDVNTNGTPRVATYEFVPPGGAWDGADNGKYTVSIEPGQVTDTGAVAVPAGPLGTFTVGIPLNIIVNATNDEAVDTDGKTSLREAVLATNAGPAADVINFDKTVFATAKTITLTLGELAITDAVTINGTGAGKLTVSGNGASRIFNIDGTGVLVVSISGMTLTGGKATGDGGALRVADEDLTLNGLTVTGNTATADGGALTVTATTSKVTINDCTFSGNTASVNGGAVNVDTTGALVVNRSTFSGNTANADGGAIYFFSGGSLTMNSSTVSGNAANAVTTSVGGGGIYFFGTVSAGGFTVTNSTISGNSTAKNAGGGVVLASFSGNALFQNSTITNNSAATAGGGIARTSGTGTVTLQSTVVAGNTNAAAPDVSFDALSDIAGDNNLLGAADVGNFTTSGAGNLTGTQATPLDAKLSALGNYGGPTQTHALLAGSPALNSGNNNATLTADQRGGTFVRVFGGQADIGAFETQPPRVLSVVVNDGSAQRSMVTKLTVSFSEAVTFPGGVAAAFQLNRTGPGAPLGSVNLNAVQVGNSAELTFAAGGAVTVHPSGSLIDGVYQLTVFSVGVQGPAGALDGNGDGAAGDDFLSPLAGAGRLHRLFGDSDGDGDNDAVDYGAFRSAFGTANPTFDFDADGDVDAVDYGQFRPRFGSSV